MLEVQPQTEAEAFGELLKDFKTQLGRESG